MSYGNSTAFIFEVSQGCGMDCQGCNVDKNLSGLPPDASMEKLLTMFRGLKEFGIPFMEIELGPTDLMKARNRDQIFTDPRVVELAQMFVLTTITASMIYPDEKDYARLAKQTHAMTPDSMVGVVFPVEMKHVFNDKYVNRILKNMEIFADNLPNKLNETILNVIFDERFFSNVGSKFTYEQLFERVNDLRITNNTKVDFVFHHGRSRIESSWVAQDLLHSVRELNRHYLRDLRARAEKAQAKHMPFQLSCDGRGGEILYHRDELYFRPVINERVTILHEEMKFKGEWTTENYFQNLFERYHSNLMRGMSFDDCSSCEHLPMCAERYIQDFMNICSTRECPTLLKQHGGFVSLPTEQDIKTITLHR